MLHQLISHNEDIRRLHEKGYAISCDNSYLVVRDIPYLDEAKNLRIGAIVSKLIFIDQNHVKQEDHQIFFCGSHPSELDGTLIKNLGGGPVGLALASPDLVVERTFSNKPLSGSFRDLFEKIESYVGILSGPAIELHNANPLTFRLVEPASNSAFKISDTLTSRAEIGDLALKFRDEVVAIIGLGGTGSYLLDFLVKTPVKEIRAFDLDYFHVHNAFRSPGKMEDHEFGKTKAEVYGKRYENLREGIYFKSKFIQADSADELEGVTFAFVCVDQGTSRAEICSVLIDMGIPFIDVGMGLKREETLLNGTLRTTYFPNGSTQEELNNGMIPLNDAPNDVYRTNIQIAELNALNACLAIIKYKQIKGFYVDEEQYNHMLLSVNDFHLTGMQNGQD